MKIGTEPGIFAACFAFALQLGQATPAHGTPAVPSPEARASAAQRATAHFQDRLPKIERGMLTLYSTDSAEVPEFSSNDTSYSITTKVTKSGLGSGITPDGYILTASHVLGKFTWVIGYMDGHLTIKPARTVLKKSYGSPGAEFAVLHADAVIDHPFAFSDANGVGGNVYLVVADRQGATRPQCLEAKILGSSKPFGDRECFILYADAPTWHGDSGGAVLGDDGTLVGVNVGWASDTLGLKKRKTICCLNPAYISSLIDEDRRRFASSLEEAAHEKPQ